MRMLFWIVTALCMLPANGFSQEITGQLNGRILDENGLPLRGVEVTAEGIDVLGIRGTVTDAAGEFRIPALPVGNVTVTISHVAYKPHVINNVKIRLGKATFLAEIRLTPTTIEHPELTVEGEAFVIDPYTTSFGENLTTEFYETLPTERDYLAIATLLPQANVSFLGDDVNISGSTGQENAYFIDGMNTTDPYAAIGSTRLPYNFVREIELKSGGYEAEFGRLPAVLSM